MTPGDAVLEKGAERLQELSDRAAESGGPAAKLAQDCIRRVEVLDYPELGMEAVWKIEVEDFPAFVVVDDKGNDFYADVSTPATAPTGSGSCCRLAGA